MFSPIRVCACVWTHIACFSFIYIQVHNGLLWYIHYQPLCNVHTCLLWYICYQPLCNVHTCFLWYICYQPLCNVHTCFLWYVHYQPICNVHTCLLWYICYQPLCNVHTCFLWYICYQPLCNVHTCLLWYVCYQPLCTVRTYPYYNINLVQSLIGGNNTPKSALKVLNCTLQPYLLLNYGVLITLHKIIREILKSVCLSVYISQLSRIIMIRTGDLGRVWITNERIPPLGTLVSVMNREF